MTNIGSQLQENLPTGNKERRAGLMRKAALELREESEKGYDPAESIFNHIKRFRESAEAAREEPTPEAIDTQTVEEINIVRPESRSDALGISSLAEGSDWVTTSAKVLRDLEGFKEKPYWDVNAFRAGYGSDTYTTASGEVKTVVKGIPVSREDAERDLMRRIQTEFGARAQETAGEAWNSYNPMQKAALTSIAYNYGSIPDRIATAVRSGNPQEVSQAILSLAGDNEGVNRRRRIKESEMMVYGDNNV